MKEMLFAQRNDNGKMTPFLSKSVPDKPQFHSAVFFFPSLPLAAKSFGKTRTQFTTQIGATAIRQVSLS